jgi:hypothetical protein
MYERCGSCSRDDQWNGWEIEIREWLARENFQAVWKCHKQYFDQSFVSKFPNSNTQNANKANH